MCGSSGNTTLSTTAAAAVRVVGVVRTGAGFSGFTGSSQFEEPAAYRIGVPTTSLGARIPARYRVPMA